MPIVYMVIGLLIIGFVVLYASGIIESSPSVQPVQNEGQTVSDNKLAVLQEISKLEEIAKINPANTDNLLKLGHMLNDSGLYQKAIDRYKQYLIAKPDEPDVIVDMGVCYFQLGKHDEAISNFKKGIEINPKHQIAHLNLGVVYSFGKNNKAEAIKWWKKTVELSPVTDIGKKAQEFLNQNK